MDASAQRHIKHANMYSCSATFADALHASPTLAAACMPLVKARNNSTSVGGLRTLRLVSKSVGQGAWKYAHHFTLGVGKEGWPEAGSRDVARLVQLLNSITLQVLTIDSVGACPRFPDLGLGDGGCDRYCSDKEHAWSYLPRFITDTGPSLSSVTHLAINTLLFCWKSPAPNMITVTSSLLAPLARACPMLETLEVNGEIGEDALSAFGTNCPRMSRLILTALSIPLKNLRTILPGLLHIEVICTGTGHSTASVEGYCSNVGQALSTSIRLQAMILPMWNIKHASTWTLLPPTLNNLHLGTCKAAPPPAHKLLALKQLSFGAASEPDSMHVDVKTLAQILQATPQLTGLRCNATSLCHTDDLPYLKTLHDRWLSSISIPPSICLKSLPRCVSDKRGSVGAFFEPSPILPAFTCLTASGHFTDSSIRQLIRVFPNLVNMELSGVWRLSTKFMQELASLQGFEVDCCELEELTAEGVLACTRLPFLKRLRLGKCKLDLPGDVLQAAARKGLVVEVQR